MTDKRSKTVYKIVSCPVQIFMKICLSLRVAFSKKNLFCS